MNPKFLKLFGRSGYQPESVEGELPPPPNKDTSVSKANHSEKVCSNMTVKEVSNNRTFSLRYSPPGFLNIDKIMTVYDICYVNGAPQFLIYKDDSWVLLPANNFKPL